MEFLYEKLVGYSKEGYYPMHMPGHKRNTAVFDSVNPYGIDITEIEGFDNLHHAEGVIKEAMERAADLYDSQNTFYLINGSTAGILAGMSACIKKGDTVLVGRNCHKAVYHGLMLNECRPLYLYPQIHQEYGIHCGYQPEKIEEMLTEYPQIKLLLITSPTYEGILSDVAAIAEIAHRHGVPLMVDEAHGAHLGIGNRRIRNSVQAGADIVVHSLHKTLPSFTQTALLHVNGNLVDADKIKTYLGIYQTSSPSYLLMASMDRCICFMKTSGPKYFEQYERHLQEFYRRMGSLKVLKVMTGESVQSEWKKGCHEFDSSKILIHTGGTRMSGKELYDCLREEYQIQLEMSSKEYALAMTSLCDTQEGFDRLAMALLAIDKELTCKEEKIVSPQRKRAGYVHENEVVISSYEAFYMDSEEVELANCAGRIAKDSISLYPPGIPLIVAGERITEELLCDMEDYIESGYSLHGLKEEGPVRMNVIKKEI